jgi:hypothetical protein
MPARARASYTASTGGLRCAGSRRLAVARGRTKAPNPMPFQTRVRAGRHARRGVASDGAPDFDPNARACARPGAPAFLTYACCIPAWRRFISGENKDGNLSSSPQPPRANAAGALRRGPHSSCHRRRRSPCDGLVVLSADDALSDAPLPLLPRLAGALLQIPFETAQRSVR